MLNRFARAFFTRLLTPIATALLRLGVRPDVVTVVGTLGVCVGALWRPDCPRRFLAILSLVAFVLMVSSSFAVNLVLRSSHSFV